MKKILCFLAMIFIFGIFVSADSYYYKRTPSGDYETMYVTLTGEMGDITLEVEDAATESTISGFRSDATDDDTGLYVRPKSGETWDVAQSGTWNIGTLTEITNDVSIDDGGNTITVDGSVTVSSTDLDIRDLTSASDSIEIYGSDDGGTTQRVIKTDADGVLQIQESSALDVSGATVTITDDGNFTLSANDGVDIGDVGIDDISSITGQDTKANSLPVTLASDEDTINVDATGQGDVPITLDSEQVDIGDISKGTQTNDVNVSLDGEAVELSDLTYADTICEVTLSDTQTWYSYDLPADTISFQATAREHYDWRVSKDSDGDQYQTIPSGGTFPPAPATREGYVTGTYYFYSDEKANQVIQIWARYKQ